MKVFILFRKYIKNILIILFWLLVWEAANFFVESRIIIVSPRETFLRLLDMALTGEFWVSISFSLRRIMFGFSLALFFGVLIAAISAKIKFVYDLVYPIINVINAVPIASFTILALMAMRSSSLPVFVAFVTVLPIIFFNTYKGIINTDPQLLEMANVFKVKAWKKVYFIYFKTVKPYVLSAANVGIGFAWKSGIAAELIGLVRGTIGSSLHVTRISLDTAGLFAWTITIVILSFIMEKLFQLIFGRGEKIGG